jgi:hypothetical protein
MNTKDVLELTERLLKKIVKLKVIMMIDVSPGEPEQHGFTEEYDYFLNFFIQWLNPTKESSKQRWVRELDATEKIGAATAMYLGLNRKDVEGLTSAQALEFKQIIRLIHHGLRMRLENEERR